MMTKLRWTERNHDVLKKPSLFPFERRIHFTILKTIGSHSRNDAIYAEFVLNWPDGSGEEFIL